MSVVCFTRIHHLYQNLQVRCALTAQAMNLKFAPVRFNYGATFALSEQIFVPTKN